MGYDIFYDQARMMLPTEGWGASDSKVFDFVSQHLSNGNRPFFNYIITMSSHEPFKNVQSYYSNDRFLDVKPEKLKDYFTSIAYVDKCLHKLINTVLEKYPHTYIFIFGDHAPYVLKNVPYSIGMTEIDTHTMQFVPMLIITPDHKVMRESRYAATFLDIAPTILQNNNLTYTYQMQGDNLLDRLKNGTIPYKGKQYDREYLYQKAAKTRSTVFGNN
jgi:phosphoglycerol transferase MdoB-like AlkP superfamily enzyme